MRYSDTKRDIPILLLLLVALTLVFLASCDGKGAAENPVGATAASPGSLVVYAARNEQLVGPIIEEFGRLTGIEVAMKYGGTSEMATTLLEEGKYSRADVFYTRDPGGLGVVADMFAALPDDLLELVPAWARSSEGNWVGITARARVAAYNTSRLSEEDLPDSISGFTDPQWEGRIGWSPTSGPTQTMFTAMRLLWGEDKTREWLEGIQANKPTVYPNHTATVAGVGVGEVDVGFVNHYYLYRFFQEEGEGFPVRNYHFRASGDPGNLVMITGAGLLETARNRENGEKLLRFLLSKVAQQYFAEQAFDYPLVDGVVLHSSLRPLSELNMPDIDMEDLSDIKGTLALLRDVGVVP